MAKKSKAVAIADPQAQVAAKVAEKVLRILSEVPTSSTSSQDDPLVAARERASKAALSAAAAAGSLALPPGPLGWLTILPELVAVWRIQAHMVADIAGYFGKQGTLTREHMVYCLFRHAASQAMRDVVVRVGQRAVVRQATVRTINAIAQRVGMRVTQQAAARTAARWLPIAGAVGVAAYAYYDTGQVAKSAIDLFKREIEVEGAEVGQANGSKPVAATN